MNEKMRWKDEWLEIHYKEDALQIARLAIEKAARKQEWWDEFNENLHQKPETD